MYIQEISIDIRSKISKDELVDQFSTLMLFYYANGQTQEVGESQYIAENKIVCLPFTLEKNSLGKKFNNFYVHRQTEKIEALCNSSLNIKTVGKSYDSYIAPCECKKSDYYILITNYATIQSPLTCGECNKPVPLYRLPIYYDYGYLPILNWKSNYVSCDRLQMNCEVGERWALNQMQEINSQLSKQGFEICKKIEELTSIPTYYFLYNYKKLKGDQLLRPCPSCKEKWDLKTPLHKEYEFKCDKCRIISTKSLNS